MSEPSAAPPRQLPLDLGPGLPGPAPEPDPGALVPGLRYVPGWLDPAAGTALLAAIDAAPWSAELRRRVQHYGHRYDYGRRSLAAAGGVPPLPGWAREAADRLLREGLMDGPAEQVIVNEYLPGQGISAHADVSCFGPVVAAVSLGGACVMEFTRPADGTRVPVRLAPGSLVVMAGPARQEWRHAIPARKSDPAPDGGRVPRERRVSVTFRTLAPGAARAAGGGIR